MGVNHLRNKCRPLIDSGGGGRAGPSGTSRYTPGDAAKAEGVRHNPDPSNASSRSGVPYQCSGTPHRRCGTHEQESQESAPVRPALAFL